MDRLHLAYIIINKNSMLQDLLLSNHCKSQKQVFCNYNNTNNLDIYLYNHYINGIRHRLYFLNYIIADCTIISSIICVIMAEYRVILSQQFTEIYFSGSSDTNNLDILRYNHYINVNRHGLYLLDYIIAGCLSFVL